MTDLRIRELLQALQDEMEQAEQIDKEGWSHLESVRVDVHSLLDTSGASEEPVLKRLHDAIEYFEVTHPRVTEVLSELLTSLSSAGI